MALDDEEVVTGGGTYTISPSGQPVLGGGGSGGDGGGGGGGGGGSGGGSGSKERKKRETVKKSTTSAASVAAAPHPTQPQSSSKHRDLLQSRPHVKPSDGHKETRPKSNSLATVEQRHQERVTRAGVPVHLDRAITKIAKLAEKDRRLASARISRTHGPSAAASASKDQFSRAKELAYAKKWHGSLKSGELLSTKGYNPKYEPARHNAYSAAVKDLLHGHLGRAIHDARGSGPLDDCTNFVSQALHAGGWKEDKHWKYEKPRWVAAGKSGVRVGGASVAWERVSSFMAYAVHSGRARIAPLSAARPGDIIIASWNGGKPGTSAFHPTHAMIVVKGSGRSVEVAAHGSNRYDFPLIGKKGQSITGLKQDATFMVLHIKG